MGAGTGHTLRARTDAPRSRRAVPFPGRRRRPPTLHSTNGALTGWTTRNLTRRYGAPAAAGRPTAYMLATDGTRHVVYREAGPGLRPTGHLIELYCGSDDVWHPEDITDEASGALATSDPSGYAFDAEGIQHVIYLSGDDGHIHELYQADGWHANDLMDASGTVVRVVDPPMGWASKARPGTASPPTAHGTSPGPVTTPTRTRPPTPEPAGPRSI